MAELSAVYVDACCFIDVVKFDVSAVLEEGRKGEVWYIKRLLQAHRDREINVFTSTITIAEAVHTGTMPVPSEVQSALDALLTSGQYTYLVQTTPFVCTDARNLRWVDGIALKGADSIHMASAIDRNCSEFLSFDYRFNRIEKHSAALSKKGIEVLNPSKTKVLPGKYLQGSWLDDEIRH